MERITVDIIGSKEFSIEAKGYNRKEVDEFLDDICDEMDRMEEEIRSLKQRNAVERPAPAAAVKPAGGADAGEFREILEMAKKVKDETILKAREDAEKILADAEKDAKNRMDNLDDERTSLKNEINELKKEAAAYRKKFEDLLASQQEQLKKYAGLFE